MKQPVRCVLPRATDMMVTVKRHPFLGKYKVLKIFMYEYIKINVKAAIHLILDLTFGNCFQPDTIING